MRPQSDIRPSQDLLSTEMYERDQLQVVAPMGGGKTAAALTAVKELLDEGFVRKAIVLAPKRVTRNVWRQEAAQWAHLHRLKIVLVAGTPAQRLKLLMDPQYDIYLVCIDITKWLVKCMRPLPREHPLYDLLIIDESSRFRNPTSKRAKSLLRISPRFKIKWLLTGTPRPRGYEDQFNPLKILTNGKLWGRSFYEWRALNFHPLDYNQYTWGLHMHCHKGIVRDINSVTVRLDPEDMPDLPALNDGPEHFIKIELPPDARDTYELMRKELVAKVDAGIITAANMAVATGKMEQIVQGFLYDEEHVAQAIHSEKLDALADFTDGLAEQPTLLVYQFHEDLAALGRLFPKLPYLGKGGKSVV